MNDFEKFSAMFHYEEETGKLFWKQAKKGRQLKYQAGNVNDQGYRVVMIDYVNYRVNRIIWLLKTGEWPKNEIDHIDRDKLNNRFGNFRDVTHIVNVNNGSPHKDSETGIKGITIARSGKWVARKRYKYLGTFIKLGDAIAAYDNAE